MEAEAKTSKIYFAHLDVVRFWAAFMIVILHGYEAWCSWFGNIGIFTTDHHSTFTPSGRLADTFILNLGIGVDIFFLISGFLITYILLEEKKRFSNINLGKFMMRRTLRIWPLYFFLILLSPFLVQLVQTPEPAYLANALFVGNFELIQSESWTFPFSHFWSICIEEHFYLIWPFIIAFVPRKYLLPTFAIIILGSIGFRMNAFNNETNASFTIFAHTLSRIDVLVIGAIGAYFYSAKPFQFKLSRLLRYALILLLVASLSFEFILSWNDLFESGFKKYLNLIIISILLLDYNFNSTFKHRLKKKSIIHYLGKISYGIYMYSNIILLLLIKLVFIEYDIRNLYLFFFTFISLSILIPILSYELFEKQILKLSKRFRRIETDR